MQSSPELIQTNKHIHSCSFGEVWPVSHPPFFLRWVLNGLWPQPGFDTRCGAGAPGPPRRDTGQDPGVPAGARPAAHPAGAGGGPRAVPPGPVGGGRGGLRRPGLACNPMPLMGRHCSTATGVLTNGCMCQHTHGHPQPAHKQLHAYRCAPIHTDTHTHARMHSPTRNRYR